MTGAGSSAQLTVRGKSHQCHSSTEPTGKNAEGFQGRQASHRAPADLFQGLLGANRFLVALLFVSVTVLHVRAADRICMVGPSAGEEPAEDVISQ